MKPDDSKPAAGSAPLSASQPRAGRMRRAFFQRRTVWVPTLLGSSCLVLLLITPALLWCFGAEKFLGATDRLPPDILVVEGWIGSDGIRAAGAEFERGGYRFVVTTSSVTAARWGSRHESYAEVAQKELKRLGLPPDKIIMAPANETERQRTYESASAVWRALDERHLKPDSLNVFTMGVHARRSRLVFAKVFGATTRVGSISWLPSDGVDEPWWRSSERTTDLLKETIGFTFEALFDSNRVTNAPSRRETPTLRDR